MRVTVGSGNRRLISNGPARGDDFKGLNNDQKIVIVGCGGQEYTTTVGDYNKTVTDLSQRQVEVAGVWALIN